MNEQLIAASRQALSCVEAWDRGCDRDAYWRDIDECVTALRAAIEAAEKQQALDKKAQNARELGLDYEPPCKTGSQCTSKCQQCAVQEPVAWMHTMDNTEGFEENEPYVLITEDGENPFGVPGEDYSESFPVTSVPLYTTPPTYDQGWKDGYKHGAWANTLKETK